MAIGLWPKTGVSAFAHGPNFIFAILCSILFFLDLGTFGLEGSLEIDLVNGFSAILPPAATTWSASSGSKTLILTYYFFWSLPLTLVMVSFWMAAWFMVLWVPSSLISITYGVIDSSVTSTLFLLIDILVILRWGPIWNSLLNIGFWAWISDGGRVTMPIGV